MSLFRKRPKPKFGINIALESSMKAMGDYLLLGSHRGLPVSHSESLPGDGMDKCEKEECGMQRVCKPNPKARRLSVPWLEVGAKSSVGVGIRCTCTSRLAHSHHFFRCTSVFLDIDHLIVPYDLDCCVQRSDWTSKAVHDLNR